MPRRVCNIIHSSGELEKSHLWQKSKNELAEHEKNIKAKGSATTQLCLSIFPVLHGMRQCLRYI